jgi:hypothetical protein
MVDQLNVLININSMQSKHLTKSPGVFVIKRPIYEARVNALAQLHSNNAIAGALLKNFLN